MKKLLMSLSLILLGPGFISSDVNASSDEFEKAIQHDVQKCLEDGYKHKDPKELISIFDQNAKKYSKQGMIDYYFDRVKRKLSDVYTSLKAYPRPANLHYPTNQKEPNEITNQCSHAVKEAERKYNDYLKAVFQGNKALIKIITKEPRPLINPSDKKFPFDQIEGWYYFSYVHVDEKLTEMPYHELRILKSANPAPEFNRGDILIIKNFETEYAMVVRPQDIEKIAPYNPS